ncbi:hypothetical protein LEP1GSC047_1423 [Leptospira inadai serovar Lyme str. 10]|uniref:Uncharacterized protein n=2 Tax=Leptospira inadai serovar Lyme TaxID=293084 RepID=V6HSK9_9LEPT|nr:hypothetical protein [Leptospira inadai]EQA35599.1 hypothetical protein LEP1GSC047_1423 [Leptospira inadai serovar Lyme str. 10]PNV75313.1 hypothetical protein BES34_008620 [Leptospira inadai serovar Lyme]
MKMHRNIINILLISLVSVSLPGCRGMNLQNFRNITFDKTCSWLDLFCGKVKVVPDLSDCDPFHEEYEGYSHYIDRGVLKDEYKIRENPKPSKEPVDPLEPLPKKRELDRDTRTDYGNNMRLDSKKLFERYDVAAGRKADYRRSEHPCSPVEGDGRPKVNYSEPSKETGGAKF